MLIHMIKFYIILGKLFKYIQSKDINKIIGLLAYDKW